MDTGVYEAARRTCAWIERQDIALLGMKGDDALEFLNRISTNDLHELKLDNGRQTVLTSDKGRIIDVVTVLSKPNELLLLLSNARFNDDVRHLRTYIVMDDVQLIDRRDSFVVFELTGPQANDCLQHVFRLSGEHISQLETRFSCVNNSLRDSEIVICRTSALCDLSFLLLVPKADLSLVSLVRNMLNDSVARLGSDEYEVLRVEGGVPKIDIELTLERNPLEANLLHLVNFKKGCYIGQEVIARLDSYNKVKVRLMGFRSTSPFQVGEEIMMDSTAYGSITSSCVSPLFGSIALGYIRNEYAIDSSTVMIRSSDNTLFEASICSLPFHQSSN